MQLYQKPKLPLSAFVLVMGQFDPSASNKIDHRKNVDMFLTQAE